MSAPPYSSHPFPVSSSGIMDSFLSYHHSSAVPHPGVHVKTFPAGAGQFGAGSLGNAGVNTSSLFLGPAPSSVSASALCLALSSVGDVHQLQQQQQHLQRPRSPPGQASSSLAYPPYMGMPAPPAGSSMCCTASPSLSSSDLSLTASLLSPPSAFEVYRQGVLPVGCDWLRIAEQGTGVTSLLCTSYYC